MTISNNSIIKYEKFDSISGMYMKMNGIDCFVINENDSQKVKAETFKKLYFAMKEQRAIVIKREMI